MLTLICRTSLCAGMWWWRAACHPWLYVVKVSRCSWAPRRLRSTGSVTQTSLRSSLPPTTTVQSGMQLFLCKIHRFKCSTHHHFCFTILLHSSHSIFLFDLLSSSRSRSLCLTLCLTLSHFLPCSLSHSALFSVSRRISLCLALFFAFFSSVVLCLNLSLCFALCLSPLLFVSVCIVLCLTLGFALCLTLRGTSELFATCSQDDIRVWHTESSKELLRIRVPNMTCNTLGFMRDGRSIYSGEKYV